MKVAIVHFRIAKVGGLETRLNNYISYLSGQGYAVTIIHAKQDPNLHLPETVKLSKVAVKWIPKPLRMWRFGNRSKIILQEENYDLTISLGRTPHQDLLVCPGTHIGFLHSTKKKSITPIDHLNIYLDRQAFCGSKIILAASEMIFNELVKYYDITPSKIRILYPPSDPKVFNFQYRGIRSKLQNRFGMDPQKKNFLFVSSGHSRKGLYVLLDIFRRLKDLPFHLIIAGTPVKTSLPYNACFIGFINDMPELYTAADALIHPAFYEPFGQVVSESLMCGTPVIISNNTGASELINDDEGLIVDSSEPEPWIKAIKQFAAKIWRVPENFAERNNLTPEKHMAEMIGIWKDLKQ